MTGPDEGLLAELGRFVADLGYSDLPPSVADRAKLTLQHNLLVALAARSDHLPGQDRERWPDGLTPAQSATRFTDGRRAPGVLAVVTNALAMGARAQHDEHPGAISHFGSAVLPALLAVAEQRGVSGADVLVAMVAGYEVGARLGTATVLATSRRGFRPTGLYGPIAGATAAGRAMGLEARALTSALAFAANSSAGVTQTWLRGTDEWRYQTAFAARNGYVAAGLADEGVRGAADTLEGANGFLRAFGADEVDPAAITEGLGDRWAIEDILLKPYPVCAFNQAPVQQLLALTDGQSIDPDRVRAVRVVMPSDDMAYPGVDVTGGVATKTAAIMDLRTGLALALLHGDVPMATLERPQLPEVLALVDRIDLVPDDRLVTHTTSVELDLVGEEGATSGPAAGTVYDAEVSRALVDRLQPLTGLDDEQVAELVATVGALDQQPNVEGLFDLVRASAPPDD